MEHLKKTLSHFLLKGEVETISPLGNGLINDTFLVKTVAAETPDYVLQRINHAIFQDVELLQNNIETITNHIRAKLHAAGETDLERKSLRTVKTREGALYYYDAESDKYWRVTLLIPNSRTVESITPQSAYLTGRAFGNFQAMLVDVPTPLGETIPNFHNMEFRLEGFQEAIAANRADRLSQAQWLVDELMNRAYDMCKAERMHREGILPKRINHCDTKVNNMLFDANGDDVLCVIDLDTTMPGYVLSDFGDFIRTAGNTAAEDEANLELVGVNMEIFKHYTQGYLETAGGFLLPVERENLPYGAKLLTYMQTVRFLTDFLNGDTYYKIKHPTHNWQRSLAQFKLLQSIEEHEAEMVSYIQSL